jgi:hypothetical protein
MINDFLGIYRGVVINNVDPESRNRLQLSIPQVFGASTAKSGWAEACVPTGWGGSLPAMGSQVWVMFEGGDHEYPVWVGVVG